MCESCLHSHVCILCLMRLLVTSITRVSKSSHRIIIVHHRSNQSIGTVVFVESVNNCQQYVTPSDRAVAQAASHRTFTAEARVHTRIIPCAMCGGHSNRIFSAVFGLSCQYHYTGSSCIGLYIVWGWTKGPLMTSVQRHILTPSTWTTWTCNAWDTVNYWCVIFTTRHISSRVKIMSLMSVS
jgi:hypothetical protein